MLEVRILPGEPTPMSQAAHCHAVSCEHLQGTLPFHDEMSSARIAINLDQWRRRKVNRGRRFCGLSDQSRSIALKPSTRLATECLPTRMQVGGLPPTWKLARPLNTSAFCRYE